MGLDVPIQVQRAFFSRFGGRLRPIQEATFHQIEPDRDVLITAGTGTGKTEAAFVPVVCELLTRDQGNGGIGALVVSPTRALATDLHTRMAPIFEALGLRLDVATGDKNTCRPNKPPDALIRTPEGLDNTLCRQPDDLKAVRAVIVDEVHFFLDNPRGTQLIGLLERLNTVAGPHRRLGVSATVPDTTLPTRAKLLRNPVLVEESGGPLLEIIRHQWLGDESQGVASFLSLLRQHECRKSIGFARTRSRIESLCQLLDSGFLRGHCLVHHGSTSSAIRKETEARLRKMRVGLVIATTTLEVGIDIGDVDTCILFDVPKSVSSFLQRAGRAGRRSGMRRVICVTGLYDRATEFSRLVGRLKTGQLGDAGDARPFLVGCLQQIASLVATETSRQRIAATQFLDRAYGLPTRASDAIIAGLVDAKIISDCGDDLELLERGQQLLERRTLHLTFASDSGITVVDELSGRALGRVRIDGDDRIRLGGGGRRIVGMDKQRGYVITHPTEGGTASFARPAESVFEEIARRCLHRVGREVQG
ncbi:MAG: DEAD/DEAH box helicase [Candidatus Competibacteraceae bacterium]|nr:DEAD/DEAH box helicase [Candidatus Competibacteraceae bacterium]